MPPPGWGPLQEDRRGLPVYVAALILFAVVFAVFFLLGNHYPKKFI
ncbi:hypothetical protein ES288_D13G127100v1 [Gossypium darwinii]|uniref:Uncharacterized protein n=1 Tax=Gossypium darwinii TaxID=34276 RepID=A0A5D2A0T7_GOSDA|nr:hypothetical protein ES288_D13G127100v1 [Gossypium darwinii]